MYGRRLVSSRNSRLSDAVRLRFASRVLGAARLLRGLGLLSGLARSFGLRRIGRRLADVLVIDRVFAH
jgi:hypothetical protein